MTQPDSEEGRFVSEQLAKGIQLDFWEKLSPEQATDFSQCSIIEAGFAALVGKLRLNAVEKHVADDSAPTVDVAAIDSAAAARATQFWASIPSGTTSPAASNSPKANFAQAWAAQGGGDKHRFCVAHNKILNMGSDGWPLTFPSALSALETSEPGDIFITRDHKSGYSVIPIRPDQRRFFCFWDPVTGEAYRCKRLDFGWSLSPGIFCAFTAELNAIIASRLVTEVDRRALARYYVDDCIVRIPVGGRRTTWSDPNTGIVTHCSANEAKAADILEDISRRANFPTSPDKIRWGSAVVYLGLLIDSSSRSACVMPSKLFKALTMLHVMQLAVDDQSVTVPASFARKAAGNLQWLAQNFRLGRLHTPALWLAAELLCHQRPQPLASCPGLREACTWWASAAATNRLQPHRFVNALDIPSISLSFNLAAAGAGVAHAVPIPLPHILGSRPVVAVLSDASGTIGIGCCWRGPGDTVTHAFQMLLTADQRDWPSIGSKELLAIVTWLERFGALYKGAIVLFGTDNAGNVFCVNRLRVDAADAVTALLLSRLLAAADLYAIECIVWWCPRALNGISDDLSKCLSPTDACRVAENFRLQLH